MRFGVALNMPGERDRSDAEVVQGYLALGDLAEPLGFDSLFVLEHHFTEYVLSPSPLQLLAYFAGRTRRINLGTAVIVLPWHDPIRVAEQIAVLDILSNGRCLFGFGRGRAELEFKGFRVPMAEARGRFLEASEIIVGCLAEDEFEYHGHFFDIPRISIRPRPASDPQERFYGSSMSAESAKIIAHLGFGMLLSTQKPWPDLGSDVVQFNRLTVEAGYTPRSPIIIGSVSVAESRNEAQERALEHIGSELTMIDAHYRYSEGQLSSITGYESYKSAESHFQRLGSHSFRKQAAAEYAEMQLVGTPNDCIDQILELHRHTGFERLVLEFSYGGLRQQEAEANMRMFAREVMPRVPNSSE